MGRLHLDDELYRCAFWNILTDFYFNHLFFSSGKTCFRYADKNEFSPSLNPFPQLPFLVLCTLIRDRTLWFYLLTSMMEAPRAKIMSLRWSKWRPERTVRGLCWFFMRKSNITLYLLERLVTECGEVKDLLAEHYHNVFQELVISTNLSNLHATLCNYQGFEYRVHGFPKLFKSSLVNEMVPLDKGPINVGLQGTLFGCKSRPNYH